MKGYTFRKRMILNAIEKEWSVYVYLYYTIFNRFLDDHILYNILLGWIKLLPQKSLI